MFLIAETERLLLRRWKPQDREPFARMNADRRVMEFMPSVLARDQSDAFADRIERHFEEHGFGLCAVELQSDHSFIGDIGLFVPRFDTHFTPCVEIGWRLSADSWGNGYATEGARAMVRHAFDILRLNEIVSFTVPANLRSRRVMEKLGMMHSPADDFDHPNLPEGHPMGRHVLYRLKNIIPGGAQVE